MMTNARYRAGALVSFTLQRRNGRIVSEAVSMLVDLILY